MKSPIVGAAYNSISRDLARQSCINLYPEIVETKTGKAPGALIGCPGLVNVGVVGSGPIRPGGMRVVQGVLYVVSGAAFYAVQPGFSSTLLGSLNSTSGPVSMIDNGKQIAISDGQTMYLYSGGVFSTVTLPFTLPGTVVYQDTLGVVNQIGTFNLWQSNVNDLGTWSALNFDTADGSSDNVVGLAELHRQIVVLKQNHCEFWINAGNPGFVFQRLDGVYPDIGCVAAASIANCQEVICWLGRTKSNNAVVYMMGGYEPLRISTYAIEWQISLYTTIDDAIGWSYSQEGHSFYVLSFPTAEKTWVYDITMSAELGYPVWHERNGFSNGNFTLYEPDMAVNFGNQVIAGSSSSGNLYRLDLSVYKDNGGIRKWLRSWRAKPEATLKAFPYRCLEIDMDTGNVDNGLNPQVMLRYSDDAYNWSHEKWAPVGQRGEYSNRIQFRRLGMERRGMATDRIFELSSTDPFKVVIISADIS